MRRFIPHLIAIAMATAGFASTGCVVRGAAHMTVAEPDMVSVGPNVWVVEDYDEPVFYSSNSYWLYRGGIWYRSGYYNRGWVRVRGNVVPVHVRRIDRPHRYVRYRAPAKAKRRGPAVRDHRAQPARTRPPVRTKQPTRDHRRPAPKHQPQRHKQDRDKRKEKAKPDRDNRKEKKKSGNVRDHRNP